MDASTDSSTGNAAEPANAVPPLPPTLRPKPQRRAIGIGKSYASTIEFNAEVAAWEAEKRARAELVKLRQKALDKQRDRSSRKRDVRLDETDSQRRVRQRHDNADATKSHAEQQSRRRGSCRLNEQIACCNSLDYKIVAALVKVVGSKFDITSPHAELERMRCDNCCQHALSWNAAQMARRHGIKSLSTLLDRFNTRQSIGKGIGECTAASNLIHGNSGRLCCSHGLCRLAM